MSGPKARKASKAKVSLSDSRTLLNGSLSTSLSSSKYDLEAMFPMTPTLKELRMKAYLDKSRNSSGSSQSKNDSLASSSGQSSTEKNIFKKPSARPTSELDVSLKMLETTLDTSVDSVKQMLGNLKSNPKKSVNMSNLSLENSLNESIPLQNGNKKIKGKVPVFDLNNISSLDHSLNETAENIILRKNPMYKRKSLHLNFSSLENTAVESDHEQEVQDTEVGKSDSVVNHTKEEQIIPSDLVDVSQDKIYNGHKSSESNISSIEENCEIVCDTNEKTKSAALEIYDEKLFNDKNVSAGEVLINNISNVVRNDNIEANSDSNKFCVNSENITEESSIDTCIRETQEKTDLENNSEKPSSPGIQNKLNVSENVEKVSEDDPEVNPLQTDEEHCETLEKSMGCAKLPEDSKCSIKNIEMSFDSSQLEDNSVNGLRRSARKKRKSVRMSNVSSLESNQEIIPKADNEDEISKGLDKESTLNQGLENEFQPPTKPNSDFVEIRSDIIDSLEYENSQPEDMQKVISQNSDAVKDPFLKKPSTSSELSEMNFSSVKSMEKSIDSSHSQDQLMLKLRKSVKLKRKSVRLSNFTFLESTEKTMPHAESMSMENDDVECKMNNLKSMEMFSFSNESIDSQNDLASKVVLNKPPLSSNFNMLKDSSIKDMEKSLDSSQLKDQLKKNIKQKKKSLRLSHFSFETEASGMDSDLVQGEINNGKEDEIQGCNEHIGSDNRGEELLESCKDVTEGDEAFPNVFKNECPSMNNVKNKSVHINVSECTEEVVESQPENYSEVLSSQTDSINDVIIKKPSASFKLSEINNSTLENIEKSLDSSQIENQLVNGLRKSIRQKRKSIKLSTFTCLMDTVHETEADSITVQDIDTKPAELQNMSGEPEGSLLKECAVMNSDDDVDVDQTNTVLCPDADNKQTAINLSGQLEETQPELSQEVLHFQKDVKQGILKKPTALSNLTKSNNVSYQNLEESLDSSQVVNKLITDVRKSIKQKKKSVRLSEFTLFENTLPDNDDCVVLSQDIGKQPAQLQNAAKEIETVTGDNREDKENSVLPEALCKEEQMEESSGSQPENFQIMSPQDERCKEAILKKPTSSNIDQLSCQNIENSLDSSQIQDKLVNDLKKSIKQKKKSVRVSDFTFLTNTIPDTDDHMAISQGMTPTVVQNTTKEVEELSDQNREANKVNTTDKSVLPDAGNEQPTLNLSRQTEETIETQPDNAQLISSSQNNLINDPVLKKPCANAKLTELNKSCLHDIENSLFTTQGENDLENGLRKYIKQKKQSVRMSDFTFAVSNENTLAETETDNLISQNVNTHSDFQNVSTEPKECIEPIDECRKDVENVILTEKSILPGMKDNQTTFNMSEDIVKSVKTQPEDVQEVISSQNNSINGAVLKKKSAPSELTQLNNSSFQDIENSELSQAENQLMIGLRKSTQQQKKSVRISDVTFIVSNTKSASNIETTQDKDNKNDESNSLDVQNVNQYDLKNKCDKRNVKSSIAKNPSLSNIPRWVGAKIKTQNEATHDKIVPLEVTSGNEKLPKSTGQKRKSLRCCDETFIISKTECVPGLEEEAKMESLFPTQDEQKTNTRNDIQELVLKTCNSESEKNTSISVNSENYLHNNAHEPHSVLSECIPETFPENHNKIISSQNDVFVLNQLSMTSNMSEMEDSYLETMAKSVDTSQLEDQLINKLRKTMKQKKESLKMSDSSLSVSCEEISSEPLKKIIDVENKKSGSSEGIPKIAIAPDADTHKDINQKPHSNSLGTSALNVEGTKSAFLNSTEQINKPIGSQLQNSSLISCQDHIVCVDALNQPNAALQQINVKDKTMNIGAEETLSGGILTTVLGMNDNLSSVSKMYEKSLLGNETEVLENKSVAVETKSLVPNIHEDNKPIENLLEQSKLGVESEIVKVLDTGNEVMSIAETSKSETSKRDPKEFVDNEPSCPNITESKFAQPNLSPPIKEVIIDEMNYKNDNFEDPETKTDEKCVLGDEVERSKDNIYKDNSNKETVDVSLPSTVEAQYTSPKSPKSFNKPIENQSERNTSDHKHSDEKSAVEREDKVPDDDNVCNDVACNITLNKFIESAVTSTPYAPEHSDKLSLSENHMKNSLTSVKTKIHEEHAMQEVKQPEDNTCNAKANNTTKSYLLKVPCVSHHSDKPIESQSKNCMDNSVEAKIDEEDALEKEVKQPKDETCNSEAYNINCSKFTQSLLPENIDKAIDIKSENSVKNSLAGVESKIEEEHALGNYVSRAEISKSQSIKEDSKLFVANKSSSSSNKERKSDLPTFSEPAGKATISETGNTINMNVLSEEGMKNKPGECSELIGKKDSLYSKVEKSKTFQMPTQVISSSERSKETRKINTTHKSNDKVISAESSRDIHFDGDILQPSNFENMNESLNQKMRLSLGLPPRTESLDDNFVNEISKVELGNPPSSPTGNFIPKNDEVSFNVSKHAHTSKPSQESVISMLKLTSKGNENQEKPASSSSSIEPLSNKETSKKVASMSNEPLQSTENKKQSGQIDKDVITGQNDKIVHHPNGDNCVILEDVAPTNKLFKMPRTSQLSSLHSPRSFLGKSTVDVTNCSIKDQNLDWSIDVSVIQPDVKNRRYKLRSQSTPLPTKRVRTKIDENNPVTPKPAIVKPNLTKQGDKKKPKKSVTFNISTPVNKSGEECHPPLDNLSDVSVIPGDDLKTNNGALSVTRSPHSLSKGENKQQSKVSSQSYLSFSESKRAPKKSISVQVTREYISSSSGEWSQSKVADSSTSRKHSSRNKSSKSNKSEVTSSTDNENINREKVLHISSRRNSGNFSGKRIESQVSVDSNSHNAVESFVQNEANLDDSVALFNPPKKQRLDKSVRDRSPRVTPGKQNLSQSKETFSSVNDDTSEVPSQRRVRALTSITNTESFRSPRLSSGNSFNDDSVMFPPKKKTKLVDSSVKNSNKNISQKSSSSITRSNYGSSQLDDSIPLGYSVSDSEESPDYRSFLNRHAWLQPVFTSKNDDKSVQSDTAVSERSSQWRNHDFSADLMPPPMSKNVLKKTKLAKPASWANQKFYKYLFDFFKPRYGIEYRKRSEDFVLFLHPYVESVVLLKEKKDYAPLVTAVKEKTKELGLCSSLWDYKYLCDYLPYVFKAKSYYCGTKLYDPVIDHLAPF